jgi:hypothetical protein
VNIAEMADPEADSLAQQTADFFNPMPVDMDLFRIGGWLHGHEGRNAGFAAGRSGDKLQYFVKFKTA